MRKKRKDFAEKIIEAEIQKEGKLLDECLRDNVCETTGPNMLDECLRDNVCETTEPNMSDKNSDEIRELIKQREAYQKELQEEVEAYHKEEKMRNSRKHSAMVKAAMLVLVASGCLFAFSMRSEATRMWWLSSVEKIIGSNRGNTVDNDEERVYSEMTEEEAAAEIEEKIGVPVPEFQYLPQGMSFDGYNYDESSLTGKIRYSYNGSIIHLQMFSECGDSSYSWNFDGEILKDSEVETDYGIVKVMEIKMSDDAESTVLAEWTYKNYQYELVGKMSFEEILLILENILY